MKSRPILHYMTIKWTRPKEGFVNCNTDESRKGNPRESAYGFCIRDNSGDLLYAEDKSIWVAINMEAETMAIWKALRYCINHGFSNIQLESNSLSLKLIIRSTWKVSWEITEITEEIRDDELAKYTNWTYF